MNKDRNTFWSSIIFLGVSLFLFQTSFAQTDSTLKSSNTFDSIRGFFLEFILSVAFATAIFNTLFKFLIDLFMQNKSIKIEAKKNEAVKKVAKITETINELFILYTKSISFSANYSSFVSNSESIIKFKEDNYLHLSKQAELLIDDIKLYYDEVMEGVSESDEGSMNRDLNKEENLKVRIRDIYNK